MVSACQLAQPPDPEAGLWKPDPYIGVQFRTDDLDAWQNGGIAKYDIQQLPQCVSRTVDVKADPRLPCSRGFGGCASNPSGKDIGNTTCRDHIGRNFDRIFQRNCRAASSPASFLHDKYIVASTIDIWMIYKKLGPGQVLITQHSFRGGVFDSKDRISGAQRRFTGAAAE